MTRLEADPGSQRNDVAALFDQAVALFRGGRLAEAKRIARRILADQPKHAQALHLLGVALSQQGNHTEGLRFIDAAMHIEGQSASIYNSRGNVLVALQRFDEAVASYDKAIALTPDYAEAFCNRGGALQELKRFDEALASYNKAIALRPDSAEAFCNRGLALQELKRFDEALASYDKAIALTPDYAEAFYSRGAVLQQLKRLDEALASYDKGIALKPDYADGYRNRALARLLMGRYREGWSDYEWRSEAKDSPSKRPNIKAPTWQGEDLSGRHLLVFSEQGLGDVIQFVRYLPLLPKREGKITFLVPAKLTRLLRPSIQAVEIVSTLNEVHHLDLQVALISLPYRFDTELSSIPNKVPYLKAEPELAARWSARIGVHCFKIGIAWQGNPSGTIDEGRSIPLQEFVPLSRIPGVRLISLQKHVGLDQLADLPKDVEIEILDDDFDSGPDAFIDTAAVMTSLDLIITADTSIAHLAGALGRPTWAALKQVPDWRWLLDREDCPWYPTVRLFRQPRRDDWASVFARINQELKSLFNASAT
jgi:tetratricopeptide (TPR) repeat protein